MDPEGLEVSEACFHKKVAQNRTIQSMTGTENIFQNLITMYGQSYLLVPWTENHLSSFKCGFLGIFSRQNLLRSLSSVLFCYSGTKMAQKCLKNHIPFDV